MKTSYADEVASKRERPLIDAALQEVFRPADDAEQPRPHPADRSLSQPPPDSFPGYQIVGEVHRGGQGVVYQAIHAGTDRKVAIKVIHDGLFAGARDRARFDREVQILGQLSHPNIVAIRETGEAACHFYYVMDYIGGQPLDVYMANGERSIEQTLRLFIKICDAVNVAHLRGVIHRDLKPGNILIDSAGEPHILDFGLAKVTAGELSGEVPRPPRDTHRPVRRLAALGKPRAGRRPSGQD